MVIARVVVVVRGSIDLFRGREGRGGRGGGWTDTDETKRNEARRSRNREECLLLKMIWVFACNNNKRTRGA